MVGRFALASEYVQWGKHEIAFCQNARDQYKWAELEEMQGDTILGQSARMNFRISCMAAPMECWMVAGGSVLCGMGEVQVHTMSTAICRGQ